MRKFIFSTAILLVSITVHAQMNGETKIISIAVEDGSNSTPAILEPEGACANPPTANAGSPQTVCAGGSICLSGQLGGSATTSTWSAPSGTFSNPASINSCYYPSISSGTVILILTTNDPDDSGPCVAASSSTTITLNPIPTVYAGTPQAACVGGSVCLNGQIGGSATSASWTATSGTFSNLNSVNSCYYPSITTGNVTLTLTTNDPDGAGPCVAVSSTTLIYVTPVPTVDAGSSQTICTGDTVNLSGIIGGAATSSIWTAASGTFSSPTSLTSSYTPAITNGTITLFLYTNNPSGPCGAAVDSTHITIDPTSPGTVNAGNIQTICAGTTVQLSGSIGGGATNPVWSAPSGSFSNVNSLTPTYTPAINSGTVAISLTANTPSGPCSIVRSTVIFTVNLAATANAGANQTICAGASVTLGGTLGGSAGGSLSTWSAPSGTFSNPTSLTSTYQPSITSGTVVLTLTSNDPAGPCYAATSTVSITVLPEPAATVSAGTSQYTCSGNSVVLAGTIGGNASSSVWSAPSGSFSDTTSLTSTYTPTINIGSVLLTLRANVPSGNCPAVSTVSITIYPAATVDAGPSQTVCAGGTVILDGHRGGGATSSSWTAVSGTYSDPSSITSTYHPGITSGSILLTLTTNDPDGTGPCLAAYDTVRITIGTSLTIFRAASICQGSSYSLPWGGSANVAGTYSHTYSTGTSCDSTVNITLTVTPGFIVNHFASICMGQTYNLPWGGSVSLAGTYSHIYTSTGGCDSTLNIMLTVNPLITSNLTAGICQGSVYTFPWGGGTSLPGIYSHTYTSVNGCDSVVNISLTVNPLPVVTLGSFSSICSSARPIVLAGGSPAGGSYSGNGVSGSTFNPALSGVGFCTITYSYTDSHQCTNTATSGILVNSCCTTAPPSPVSITGPATVCNSPLNVLYSCPLVPGATSYEWQVTTGGTLVSSSGNSAHIGFPPSGSTVVNVKVRAVNSCGASGFFSFPVSVRRYCTHKFADSEYQADNLTGKVYPNPSTGNFQVEFTINKSTSCRLILVDIAGKKILEQNHLLETGTNLLEVNADFLIAGIYFLRVEIPEEPSKTWYVQVID